MHLFSRTNVPHLDPEYIKLNAFIGKRLIAERLTRCTDSLFEAVVNPQSVVTVTAKGISLQYHFSEYRSTYPPPRLRNPVSQNII